MIVLDGSASLAKVYSELTDMYSKKDLGKNKQKLKY